MNEDELPRIAHDPAAFEAFYRRYVEDVQRFIARRVDDPHAAADLTAEVFLAAIGAAPGYESHRGVPIAWLFGIARNVTSAERRRAARERRANARIQGRRLLEPDDVARMQERIDAAARARELHAALAALPDGERAALDAVLDRYAAPYPAPPPNPAPASCGDFPGDGKDRGTELPNGGLYVKAGAQPVEVRLRRFGDDLTEQPQVTVKANSAASVSMPRDRSDRRWFAAVRSAGSFKACQT